jgi:hypothetical protein
MANTNEIEIKPLRRPKEKSPALWSMFLDGTDPPSFSYTRIVGFLFVVVFLFLVGYLSISTGTLIIPSKEWVYILIAFSLMKPIQRFAESKDNENQLNYDFQMAQLEKKIDNVQGS